MRSVKSIGSEAVSGNMGKGEGQNGHEIKFKSFVCRAEYAVQDRSVLWLAHAQPSTVVSLLGPTL